MLQLFQVGGWGSAASWRLTFNNWRDPITNRDTKLYWDWKYTIAEEPNGLSEGNFKIISYLYIELMRNFIYITTLIEKHKVSAWQSLYGN